MTEIEALYARHSVRNYQDKKIEPEKAALLNEKIAMLNKAGNIKLQFIEDAGNTFNRLMNKMGGLGSAPSVIACVGPISGGASENDAESIALAEKYGTDMRDASLEERIGYYGQSLVLYAQELGLNTCWAGTYNKKALAGTVSDGEKLVIVIAIGHGETQGKERKTKSYEKVTKVSGECPEWFGDAVKAALLAPTAINEQQFEISCNDGKISFRDKGGVMGKVDLGIVKYNFKVGAEAYKKQD